MRRNQRRRKEEKDNLKKIICFLLIIILSMILFLILKKELFNKVFNKNLHNSIIESTQSDYNLETETKNSLKIDTEQPIKNNKSTTITMTALGDSLCHNTQY